MFDLGCGIYDLGNTNFQFSIKLPLYFLDFFTSDF